MSWRILLWIVNGALQCALVALLCHRRAYRRYLTFFVLIGFGMVQTLTLVTVQVSPAAYFWTYWCSEAILSLLTAAALQDMFERTIPVDDRLRRKFAAGFYAVIVAAICLAIFLTPNVGENERAQITARALRLQQGMRIIQAILIAAIGAAWLVFRMRLDKLNANICLGLSLIVAVDAVAVSEYVRFGEIGYFVYTWAKPLVYSLAFVTWIVAFAKAVEIQPMPRREDIESLERRLSQVFDAN